ncbi:hypothetical protein PF005_g30956 [Phytophthora fragariae]|nr:hypothetical protein PF009_g30976 [Phytophthora fragariae]KAE9162175.1 hypothetical protein PF005_g30956 [Phytophthora fragariae]
MRELVMDGAPELNGAVVEALVNALQAKQLTPVPYRPALLGLVERFHRTWKDMVAMFVSEAQSDWDRWLPCAAYAYNGARHSGTGYSPNELMMGRRLRTPNELLRTSGVTQVGVFADYHRALVKKMAVATEAAKKALSKDQARRARYYDRQVRRHSEFQVGDKVWVLRPPRGKGITKLAHKWVGPARIEADAGFDNWEGHGREGDRPLQLPREVQLLQQLARSDSRAGAERPDRGRHSGRGRGHERGGTRRARLGEHGPSQGT